MKNFSKRVCCLLMALFLGHEGVEAMLSIKETIQERMEREGITTRRTGPNPTGKIILKMKAETNPYPAIQVESTFGVVNGLSGMKRDVILKLFRTFPIGYGKEHEYPVRIVIGMCAEHYAWIKHMYFVEYRSLSTQPCRPDLVNYRLVQYEVDRKNFTLGFTEQEIDEQCGRDGLSGKTLTEFVNYFEGKELNDLEKAARNKALLRLNTDTIVPEFQVLVKDRPNSFLFEINTFGLFLCYTEIVTTNYKKLEAILLSITPSMLRALPVRFIVGLGAGNNFLLERINEDLGGKAFTKPQQWTRAGMFSLRKSPAFGEIRNWRESIISITPKFYASRKKWRWIDQ